MAQDVQILPFETKNAPNSWVIPDALKIMVKTIEATFDGAGAGSAFLPAVQILSDSGHSVGIFPTDSTVAAGGSAEVTFAPFLRNAAAASPSTGMTGLEVTVDDAAFFPNGGGFAVVPTGTVCELGWRRTQFIGSLNALTSLPIGGGTAERVQAEPGGFGGKNYALSFHIRVVWPAFSGLRYIELVPDNTDPDYANFRVTGSVTPDDDIQILSGTFSEQTDTLTNMVVNVFQASGVNKTISGASKAAAQFVAVGPFL